MGSGERVSLNRHVAMFADILGCRNLGDGGRYWHPVVEAGGAAEHPPVYQTALTTKTYPTHVVTGATAEKCLI